MHQQNKMFTGCIRHKTRKSAAFAVVILHKIFKWKNANLGVLRQHAVIEFLSITNNRKKNTFFNPKKIKKTFFIDNKKKYCFMLFIYFNKLNKKFPIFQCQFRSAHLSSRTQMCHLAFSWLMRCSNFSVSVDLPAGLHSANCG